MQLTKDYIVEGYKFKEKSEIFEEIQLMFDKDGNVISEDSFMELCKPILKQIEDMNIIDNNSVEVKKDITDYCKREYARYSTMPTIENVVSYVQNRNQTFAV